MDSEFCSTINLKQLIHLSDRLGASKRLQILLCCLRYVESNGEFKLPVTKTSAELSCSREYVSRTLSELVNQGVLIDLSHVSHPGRKGRHFKLIDGLVPQKDFTTFSMQQMPQN